MSAHAEAEQQKAEVLREALYVHCHQVRNYIESTMMRIESYEGEMKSSHEAELAARGRLLVMQLKSLLISARRSVLLRGMMNLEQVEAQISVMESLVHQFCPKEQNFSEECSDAA